MKKTKTRYRCSNCGATFPKWLGRCPNCNLFNTIEEVQPIKEDKKQTDYILEEGFKLKPITSIDENLALERISTGIKNLDEALFGGFVKGQVLLISGEPGIGKSTLLLQVASEIAKSGNKVIYISGEEAENQIFIRGKRINALSENLFILSETNLERILAIIEREKPEFVIIDSIQTIQSEKLESIAGSISQVKEASNRLVEVAKRLKIPLVIVGQITKEGNIAGPKILEHLVDSVVYFEGERGHAYRVLKVIKNRFGATGEIAVFNMSSKGLEEVKDPSAFFLAEKHKNKSGSVIFPFTEGSKPLLVEIQALVYKTFYPVPQRKTQGIDINKLSIITAILEKELNINLSDKDIFINVVGGIYIKEPAVDLPIALAILSSYFNKPIPSDLAVFGEMGLTGEVRSVYYTDLRIKEAKKFGIKKILVPSHTDIKDSSLIKIKEIKELKNLLLENGNKRER